MTVKEQLIKIKKEAKDRKKQIASEKPSHWLYLNEEGVQHYYDEMFDQKRAEQRVLFDNAKENGVIGMLEEITGEDLSKLFDNRGIYVPDFDRKPEWVVDIQNPILFEEGEWDTSLGIRVFHLSKVASILSPDATFFTIASPERNVYSISGEQPVFVGRVPLDPELRIQTLEYAIATAMYYPDSTKNRLPMFYNLLDRLYLGEPPRTIEDYPFTELYHNKDSDRGAGMRARMYDKEKVQRVNRVIFG